MVTEQKKRTQLLRRKIVFCLIRGLLIFLGILFAWLLAELVVRIVIPAMPKSEGKLFIQSENPLVVYEMVPNAKAIHRGVEIITNRGA